MRGLQATLPGNWGRLAVAVMFLFDWRFNVTLHPRGGCWLSTVYKGPGSEAIDLWGKWSGNVQVVLWDRSARSPGGQARPGHAVTSCIFDMRKQIHRFFIGVLGFRSRWAARRKAFRGGSGFSKTRKGALDFKLRDFMLFSCWVEAERKRYSERRKSGHYIPDKFITLQSPSRFVLFYSLLVY